jgi:hypothetical protein
LKGFKYDAQVQHKGYDTANANQIDSIELAPIEKGSLGAASHVLHQLDVSLNKSHMTMEDNNKAHSKRVEPPPLAHPV